MVEESTMVSVKFGESKIKRIQVRILLTFWTYSLSILALNSLPVADARMSLVIVAIEAGIVVADIASNRRLS